MGLLVFFLLATIIQEPSFREIQMSYPRVKTAYREKEATVKGYFHKNGITYGGFRLFIRVFKDEQRVEAWVLENGGDKYKLLHTFPFCATSGTLGPKRREGDLQIPEGVYSVNHFNPESNFFLSLGVSYPSASDRILSDPRRPGGAIYIHGNCVTIGCIPITDDMIKELYILAVEARNNGQKSIPIHIFPSKLDDDGLRRLVRQHGNEHAAFWQNLQPVYLDFERTGTLRRVSIDSSGQYALR